MLQITFAWNEKKNEENQRKHGISFDEAKTVFVDEYALLTGDPDHSSDEQRFVLLGMRAALRTVVVCHCYRDEDEVIRIISARKATRKEQNTYKRGRTK